MEKAHSDTSHHEDVVIQKMTTRGENVGGKEEAESQYLLDESCRRSLLCRDISTSTVEKAMTGGRGEDLKTAVDLPR